MTVIIFDGQQTDEVIFATLKPHPYRQLLEMAAAVILGIFFTLVVINVAALVPVYSSTLRLFGLVISLVITMLWVFWIYFREGRSCAYVTDRRLIRFDPVTPFLTTKRSLFWNEVLKAKAYSPNIFLKFMKIGNLVIEPHLSETENIRIRDVTYAEDLANYIDKILYLTKNNPAGLAGLKPFIAKPRGQRD